jgi:VCBS repeat-containing protein
MAVTTPISSQIALSGEARVDSVHGTVRVINAQGEERLLKAGDLVHVGERIVAEADGSAVLLTASGDSLVIEGGRLVALDEVILNPQAVPDSHEAALQAPSVQQQAEGDTNAILQALEAGQDPFAVLAPAAAGLSGAGGEDGGSTFIRLVRITEGLTYIGLVGRFDIANLQQNDLGGALPAFGQHNLGPNNGVTLGDPTPVVQGGEGTVYEAGLGGSSNPEAAIRFTGTFSVTALAGLNTIVVGGVTMVAGNALTANTTITTVLGNTLTITGFDPASGAVSYSYTLNAAEAHASGNGNNSLFDTVSVTATDVDGHTTTSTLSVNIVDDVPTAHPDSASVSEDGTLVASANVLANDTTGADSPATVTSVNGSSANVGVAIAGLYGTLTLHADGSYTYILNNGSAAVQGLSVGEHLNDSFSYVMQDADGDLSSSTLLTITINGTDDGVTLGDLTPVAQGGDGTVYEAALSTGSDPSATSESVSGTFTVTAADGLDDIVIGGVKVVDHNALTANTTVTTALGSTLTITGFDPVTGVVSYSYTLDAAETHASGNGNNSLFDTVSVTVTDVDGSTTTSTLSVNIVDDVPSAFTPDSAHMVDQTVTSHSVTDELNFAGHTGADGLGNVVFNITEGITALDADGNQLRLDGVDLFLYYGADHSELVAKTATGDIGFTVDINPVGDSYRLTTYGIISSGDTTVSSLTNTIVGGGNTAFKGLIDIGNSITSADVLVSTAAGSTVNTNNSLFGIGSGQSIAAGELIRFDLVDGLNNSGPFPVGDTTGFVYQSHNSVSAFEQSVRITGNGTANLTVSAIQANDNYSFIGDGSDSLVHLSVSNVKIFNGAVDVTSSVTLVDNGDSISINGMQDGWSFQVATSGGVTFNAVEVEGAAETHTFKLGAFSYTETAPGQPIDLSFGITASDGDGDPVASQIDATLYPADRSLEGDGGGNTLTATLSHPFVFGDGGDDALDGSVGQAVLVGGDGNDLLVYGIGDTIDGGNGFDTLRIDSAGVVNLAGAPLSDVEQLLMSGASTNTTLQLRPEDVLNFTHAGDHTLFVRGQAGDALNVDVADPVSAPAGTSVTIDGVDYVQFHLDVSGSTVTINVEHTVQTHFI